MDIKSEILALLENLNCEHEEDSGIIVVTTPDGEIWDFSAPERVAITQVPAFEVPLVTQAHVNAAQRVEKAHGK